MKLEAGEPGKLIAEYQETCSTRRICRKDLLSRWEPPAWRRSSATEPPDRLPNGRVLIIDGDSGTMGCHVGKTWRLAAGD